MRIELKSKKPLALSIAAIVLMVAAGVFSITSNSKADASAPEGMAPLASAEAAQAQSIVRLYKSLGVY